MREPSRFLLEMPPDALVVVAGGRRWSSSGVREPAPRWGSSGLREPAPRIDDEPLDDSAPLRVGARVRHGRWGEGRVIGVQKDGEDWVVTVNFAAVGRKRLALQYAQLEEL